MFHKGEVQLLYIKYDGDFLPIGCLTSNSFSEGVDTLPATTIDDGGWKKQILTNQFYSISFSGLIINTAFTKGDFSKVSYDRIKQIKRNKEVIQWKISDDVGLFIEQGYGQITSLSSASSVDDMISFEGEILGYGEPTSSTELTYELQDGNDNPIQDGNDNIIKG